MIDYEQLVKALRCGDYKPECGSSDCPYWSGLGCMDGQLMEDSADAIEALLKENKELIEDRPEMVEADGHWEWRKPNGEVLLPKRGEWYTEPFDGDKKYQCSNCLTHWDVETRYCPFCGAKMEVQE